MGKDWQAVADAINTRLAELGMSQKGLSEASRVSVATLRKLQKAAPAERGAPLLAAVSVALHWPPGYLEALSAGDQVPTDPTAPLRDEVAELRAELEDFRTRLAKVEAAQKIKP